MPVDRCVCHSVPFTEIRRLVDAGITRLDQLADRTGCTTGCGMCEPYVRLVIATGQTEFTPMNPAEIDRLLAEAERIKQPKG